MHSAALGRAALTMVVAATASLLPTTAAAGAISQGPEAIAVGATPRWEVVDLGLVGGGYTTTATAINAHGTVAGYGIDAANTTHAVVWQGQAATVLPTPGGPDDIAWAEDINDHGTVVGRTVSVRTQQARPVLWQRGRARPLQGLPAGDAVGTALNDRGQVVGYRSVGEGRTRAFLWERGRYRDLLGVDPDDPLTIPDDIDEDGTVVGYGCGDQGCYPIRWRRGVPEQLSTPTAGGPGQTLGGAVAVDRGRVVGSVSPDAGPGPGIAVLWDRRGRHDLPVPTSNGSNATGIAGRYIAGSANFVSPEGVERGRAVLWRDGTPNLLDGLAPTGNSAALDVNARGWAVGIADPPGGQSHAVLWRPRR